MLQNSNEINNFWGTGLQQRTIGDLKFEILNATAPAEEVVSHMHDDAHLIYVLKGQYVSSARDAPPIATTPVVIANPPGTYHRDHFYNSGGKFLAVSGPADYMGEGHAKLVQNLYLISAMHSLADAMSCGASDLEIDELGTLILASEYDAIDYSAHVPDWMNAAYQMVMEAPVGELNMTFLADAVGAHPVHIARTFKKHTGKTAGEILRARQIEKAFILLRDSDIPLAAMAHDLGFHDQAHFTHSFRRATGITPKVWRNQNLQQVA